MTAMEEEPERQVMADQRPLRRRMPQNSCGLQHLYMFIVAVLLKLP